MKRKRRGVELSRYEARQRKRVKPPPRTRVKLAPLPDPGLERLRESIRQDARELKAKREIVRALEQVATAGARLRIIRAAAILNGIDLR